MGIRWCYIVEYVDNRCGVVQRERFLWPNDAKTRQRQLLEAGFYGVRYRQHRVRAGGPSTSTAPGIFRNGRPIAGQEWKLCRRK